MVIVNSWRKILETFFKWCFNKVINREWKYKILEMVKKNLSQVINF